MGVDIFFVISGYLISLILFRELSAGAFSFANFYARRVRRLFPALVVVLSATIAFGGFVLFADEYKRLGKHAASAILFLLNFRLIDEAGYFDVASVAKPLLHLWSLSVEEQFYLFWPLLLVLLRRLGLQNGSVLAILSGASLIYALDLAQHDFDALFFHPLARFWELLAGSVLAHVHHQEGTHVLPSRIGHRIKDALSAVGLVAIILPLLLWHRDFTHPGWLTIVPVLGAVIVIACGSLAAGNRLLALKPLVWIGLISYPLYLWHWPILSFLHIVESGKPHLAALWLGAGFSLLLAATTYRYIEQPLRVPLQSRTRLVGLMGTMGVLLAISVFVVKSDGLPNRPALRHDRAAEAYMKREPAQDQACMARFAASVAPVYCRQQGSNERMIAVIGDSHAHVLFDGVAALAAKLGYGTLLLANSSCPPFDGAVTGRNLSERSRCAANIETILTAIERDSSVKFTVIASRGPQYISGSGFGPAEETYLYPPISAWPNTDSGSLRLPADVFRDGIKRTVKRLHEQEIKVAYVLQVPELGVSVRNCMQRPWTLTNIDLGCTVAYPVYRNRMFLYRSLIEQVSTSLNFMSVADLESVFCNEASCNGRRDGQLLYADDNHLNIFGSNRVAPAILNALGLKMSD